MELKSGSESPLHCELTLLVGSLIGYQRVFREVRSRRLLGNLRSRTIKWQVALVSDHPWRRILLVWSLFDSPLRNPSSDYSDPISACNSLCTLDFSILKSDADQAIEAEEDCNGDHSAVTDQFVPVAGQSLPSTMELPPPLSHSWLNSSVLDSGCNSPRMPQLHQPVVRKPRRGFRSRSPSIAA